MRRIGRMGLIGLMGLAGPLPAMEPAGALRVPDANVARAAAYSRKCGGQALVVLQAGAKIHESYANGGAPGRAEWVKSVTKNLAAVTVFAARADGLLDLDEPVSRTLSEWRESGAKKRITIRQLLDQTAGLAPGYGSIYASGVKDKNRIAVGLPVVAEPGALFDYGPGNYEVIEEVLRRKLAKRGTTPLAYLVAKVLRPIGVVPADWRLDRSGTPFFSAGAKLTARDLAKFGEFVRTRGRIWIVPYLPERDFREIGAGSEANRMYGLSFWLNANARRPGADAISIEGTLGDERSPAEWARACISSVAPPDLIAMIGSGGLRCYIVPSRKLVVVRFGTGTAFSDAEFLARLFR